MKTKSRFLPPNTRKVGHHPYIYLPVSMTKWRRWA
jgi:starvation-inducible outer membrane lipoprotein